MYKPFALLVLIAGCSTVPLTEEQQFQKEYDKVERNRLVTEKFYKKKASCKASGGYLIITKHGPGRIKRSSEFTIDEMRFARCVSSLVLW